MGGKKLKAKPVCNCGPATMKYLSEATNNRGGIYHCREHGQIKVIAKITKQETSNEIYRKGM